MRGKDIRRNVTGTNAGITPAYAGKSDNDSYAASDRQDHPRLCGEKAFSVAAACLRLGSPPPMRGKVHRQ